MGTVGIHHGDHHPPAGGEIMTLEASEMDVEDSLVGTTSMVNTAVASSGGDSVSAQWARDFAEQQQQRQRRGGGRGQQQHNDHTAAAADGWCERPMDDSHATAAPFCADQISGGAVALPSPLWHSLLDRQLCLAGQAAGQAHMGSHHDDQQERDWLLEQQRSSLTSPSADSSPQLGDEAHRSCDATCVEGEAEEEEKEVECEKERRSSRRRVPFSYGKFIADCARSDGSTLSRGHSKERLSSEAESAHRSSSSSSSSSSSGGGGTATGAKHGRAVPTRAERLAALATFFAFVRGGDDEDSDEDEQRAESEPGHDRTRQRQSEPPRQRRRRPTTTTTSRRLGHEDSHEGASTPVVARSRL